ncbi:hypothetical protein HYY71_02405 [Candidatus Woesearchaeota archaeon]|nr:hypothetical protein [Candidatus Woesearchaeota archaeon]
MKRKDVEFNEDLIDCINFLLREQEKSFWFSQYVFKKKWGESRGQELHTFLSYNNALSREGTKIRIIIPEGIRLREEAQLRIIAKEQKVISKKQTDIQNKQYWINIILIIIFSLQLISTSFIGWQTIKLQYNFPDIILFTNPDHNFINVNKKIDKFNHYRIYVFNQGKAPCLDLKINNIKFAKNINRIISAKSNNPINEFLGIEQEYYTLLNKNCFFDIRNNETFCNPYIGLIKPNEVISLGVEVDIAHYENTIHSIDRKINFDIEANCIGSKFKLPVTVVLDTSKP